ncbi:hypothetical protein EMIHUDRAFT_252484 [Emiliania huxleyi CCMP1516]|uniref:Uncharacterized protein n=2 Tax=Emiliania huxleyi TaxID=2903 RepID=A0A0D3KJP9_EMIH1|nr:hypothetical protein EMIHUDRAFT_252484 [Emiliania huxleyi CCMP1516]EOD35984.1 hypothetical protein EMIHUDRAFT_252484 [Emiliania huxleyi CCMP1516]|eukprot:XP_005788413.1 hypothetical protein EMIHUDRAFT_252484 [Emiliania huxleyi CCMP1516]
MCSRELPPEPPARTARAHPFAWSEGGHGCLGHGEDESNPLLPKKVEAAAKHSVVLPLSLRRSCAPRACQHDAATAEAVSDARARYADPSSNWRSLSESTNFEWKFLTPLVWAPAFPFLRRAPPSVRPYVFGGAILVANMHGFNNPDLSDL